MAESVLAEEKRKYVFLTACFYSDLISQTQVYCYIFINDHSIVHRYVQYHAQYHALVNLTETENFSCAVP